MRSCPARSSRWHLRLFLLPIAAAATFDAARWLGGECGQPPGNIIKPSAAAVKQVPMRRALLVAAASSTALVRAFAPPMPLPRPHTRCAASAPGEPEAEGERDEAEGAAEAEEELLPAARIQSSGLETIDDFRLTRSRLTFRRSQEVQRRRPRHLPYDEAAKWARARAGTG